MENLARRCDCGQCDKAERSADGETVTISNTRAGEVRNVLPYDVYLKAVRRISHPDTPADEADAIQKDVFGGSDPDEFDRTRKVLEAGAGELPSPGDLFVADDRTVAALGGRALGVTA